MGRRMTKIRLKYIKEYRSKGETYRYFRRKGCPQMALPGEPGSREFNAAYEAALGEKPIPASRYNAGTMGQLIADYYRSADYENLKPGSRRLYRTVLDPIGQEHGHRLVRDMGRDHARKMIERIGATRRGMAESTRKVLSLLMGFAVDTNVRNDNPVRGITAYRLGTRHSWTDEQLSTYEARWALGTRERLAFATLLYSGQRGGDVVKLKRPDAKASVVTLTQEKTGTDLTLPIHPDWRAAINAGPSLGLSLLGNEKGRPITRRQLTTLIRDAVREAGLPAECKPHGLRKAGTSL